MSGTFRAVVSSLGGRLPLGVAVVASALLLTACGADPAEQVLGSQYRSTTEAEVGLGPEGVVNGTWTISFVREKVEPLTGESHERDAYSWQFSDYGDAGTFSFDGDLIILESFDEGAEPLEASYDPETNTLELEGMTYAYDKAVDSL